MKRIFIAIKISLEIQKKADEWKAGLRALPVRWIPEENLHITLIPPWEEENIEEIISKAEKIRGKINPFAIEFQKITYGPNSNNPRLIWACGDAVKNLVRLKNEIAKLLGAEQSNREFKPHLTLARFRPENYFNFPIKNLNEHISWKEKVGSICLMESILKSEGAEYKILKTIKLNF